MRLFCEGFLEKLDLVGDACVSQPPGPAILKNSHNSLEVEADWQSWQKNLEGAVTGWEEASHSFLSPLTLAASPTLSLPRMELTGGFAAIDLPVIMGVTEEPATCLQKHKKLHAGNSFKFVGL